MNEKLPRRIRHLVELIGWSQTLRLLNAKGGTAVYFPCKPENADALAFVISREALATLCEEFGGLGVQLPKPDKMLIAERNRQIVVERAAGATTSELAGRFGITTRMVQNILADCDSRLRREA